MAEPHDLDLSFYTDAWLSKLTRVVVHKYHLSSAEAEDCVHAGLLRGIETYDPHRGAALSSWAQTCIYTETLRVRGIVQFGVDYDNYESDDGDEEDKKVALALRERVRAELHRQFEDVDCQFWQLTPAECFEFADRLLEQLHSEPASDRARERVHAAIGSLSSRHRVVLTLRYGLGDIEEHSATEIGEQVKLTGRQVNNIIKDAMRILREALTGEREQLALDLGGAA